MTKNISEIHIKKFEADIRVAAQKMDTRLLFTISPAQKNTMSAEEFGIPVIGSRKGMKVRADGGQTIFEDLEFRSRRLIPINFNTAYRIPKNSMNRVESNLQNVYKQMVLGDINDRRDLSIIEALTGVAREGKQTLTDVLFDDSKSTVFADGSTGVDAGGTALPLNVSKILTGVSLIKSKNVKLGGKNLYCLISSKQETDLLTNEIQFTSSDYTKNMPFDKKNHVNILGMWNGITFIQIEELKTTGSGASRLRECVLYTDTALNYGINQEADITIDRLPTLQNDYGIQANLDFGLVRTEDAEVVKIECLDPTS